MQTTTLENIDQQTNKDTKRILSATVERITPQKAAFYLASNVRNRPLSMNAVNQFAGAMQRGEWKVTHQGIAFDTHGHLIDGQHRLKAIVVADVAIEMAIMTDMADDSFGVIDVGRKRKFSDTLALQGEDNAFLLAATANWKWRYDNNSMNTGRRTATTAGLQETLDAHPNIRNHLMAKNALHPDNLVPPSVAAWLMYEFSAVDPNAATNFWNDLGTGNGLAEGNPILALRNRLFDVVGHARGMRVNHDIQAAWIIKAWNAVYQGRTMQQIRFGEGEQFPVIADKRTPPKE